MGKYSTIGSFLIAVIPLSIATLATIKVYPTLSVILFVLCNFSALICLILTYIEVRSWR